MLWNFTVMGEAASQLVDEVKTRFPDISWAQPSKLRNRVIHGYWSIDIEILHTTAETNCQASSINSAMHSQSSKARRDGCSGKRPDHVGGVATSRRLGALRVESGGGPAVGSNGARA